MKQKRAIRILTPARPLRAGTKEVVELSLKLPKSVHLVSYAASFEGRCRSSFSGQDSQHTLVDEKLYIPFGAIQLPNTNIIPDGLHRLPIFLAVPLTLPGTFTGKSGAIAYRFVVKMKIKRTNSTSDEGIIECEKAVDVLGRVSLDQHPAFAQPVSIDRQVKKKILFLQRLDAHIKFEVDSAAFTIGQHILMTGEVKNNHPSIPIKHIGMELRQHILYISGDSQRSDTRLISRLILGSVEALQSFPIHHSIQIPFDCYPSLNITGNPVQVSYELLLTNSNNFEIGTPVFIGNVCGKPSRQSITYPESSAGSTAGYYCVPPTSEYGGEPPPYSTYMKSEQPPTFVPIHMLKTPYRPFAPNFSMFGPPKYDYNCNMAPSPPPQRFLKIEEIE